MEQHVERNPIILRAKQAQAAIGLPKSSLYAQIGSGLFPRPVALSSRAVGWPAYEVASVIAARIAGKTDEEIRALVLRLEAARNEIA
jgi:prophage regulatory protein